jgi:hypothetical protein
VCRRVNGPSRLSITLFAQTTAPTTSNKCSATLLEPLLLKIYIPPPRLRPTLRTHRHARAPRHAVTITTASVLFASIAASKLLTAPQWGALGPPWDPDAWPRAGQKVSHRDRGEREQLCFDFHSSLFFPIPIELVVRGGPLTDKVIAVPTRLGKDADASVSSIYRPPWRNAIALPTNSPPQPVADIAHGLAAGTNSGAFGTVSRRRNRPKECEDSGGVCVIIIMLAFSARFYVDIFSWKLRC